MWLASATQEEIAEACGEPPGTIGRLVSDPSFLHSVLENQTKKAAAGHANDFEPHGKRAPAGKLAGAEG
jgi:hypothetical protein